MKSLRLMATALAVLLTTLLLSAPPSGATFPGSDGRIAFTRANQIYTVTSAGSGLLQLTTAGKNYRPAWSPNGQRIAYIHETATGARDIWVMAANGTNKQQVTRVGTVTTGPSWRPDGRFLAFASGPQFATLRRVDAIAPFDPPTSMLGYYTDDPFCGDDDPSDTVPLAVDRYLAWSPNGNRIAINDHQDCQLDNTIHMYFPATREARRVLATGGECCGDADWSDLVFGPANQFGYAVVDYDENFEPLPSKIVYPGFTSIDYDRGPAPSPSGTYMALTNVSTGTPRIFITNINGSGRHFLVNGYQPSWQSLP